MNKEMEKEMENKKMVTLSQLRRLKDLELEKITEFICTEHEYLYHIDFAKVGEVVPWNTREVILDVQIKKEHKKYHVFLTTTFVLGLQKREPWTKPKEISFEQRVKNVLKKVQIK